MEFQFIVNPQTNRKCSIHSKQGQRVLKNYLNQSGGMFGGPSYKDCMNKLCDLSQTNIEKCGSKLKGDEYNKWNAACGQGKIEANKIKEIEHKLEMVLEDVKNYWDQYSNKNCSPSYNKCHESLELWQNELQALTKGIDAVNSAIEEAKRNGLVSGETLKFANLVLAEKKKKKTHARDMVNKFRNMSNQSLGNSVW